MLIFELLDQYEGICRRAFFGCGANVHKNREIFMYICIMRHDETIIFEKTYGVLPPPSAITSNA